MLPAGAGSFRRSFRPELAAASEARQALDDLRPHVDDDLLHRSRLALTEVVTNSVKHARLGPSQLIDVQVALLIGLVHIEVIDDGPGFHPVMRPPAPNRAAVGGWGLWLVDRLTDRWGVDCSHSTCVWLEFDRKPRSSSARARTADSP